MYPVAIVDDEKHQQDHLTELLQKHFPDYRIVATCSSVEDGVEKINLFRPILIFLDVVMPPYNGFDLLNRIPERNFDVIFTTSYEHFALQAFKVSAVDYLLKPFGKKELQEALSKFEAKKSSLQSRKHLDILLQNVSQPVSENTKIALPTLTGFIFVEVKDIVRCRADNTYTTVSLIDKRQIVISRSIKECEAMLEDFNFFRTHVSHLINLKHITEYHKGDGGAVKMSDGFCVDISRLRKDKFLKRLNRL